MSGMVADLSKTPRIFISAVEPSADRHAADLILKIRALCPAAQFIGIAGPLMQAAGCQAIDDWTQSSAMLVGAVRLARRAWQLLGRVGRILDEQAVDLAVLVDSPALHLPMAKKIRKRGCKILYYIAPQLWAWAPWRIRRVRKRVDRLAVILPFEEEYFRKRGVEAKYVGHPLIEQLSGRRADTDMMSELKAAGKPVVACLPGSRMHVVNEVLPGQIEVARAIAGRHPGAAFLFAAANPPARDTIRQALDGESFTHQVIMDRNVEILSVADLALCASGTATLEVAYYRLPMVVMYNGSKWGYRLVGRWLIHTLHLSLVNILAGRCIVPEFMPYYDSTDPIIREAIGLLEDTSRRHSAQRDLNSVIESLGTTSAAEQTARMIMDII